MPTGIEEYISADVADIPARSAHRAPTGANRHADFREVVLSRWRTVDVEVLAAFIGRNRTKSKQRLRESNPLLTATVSREAFQHCRKRRTPVPVFGGTGFSEVGIREVREQLKIFQHGLQVKIR